MKKSILLIGDTIVDRYHYLEATGLSLESPTLKCNKISTRDEYGGAANVAKILSSLGCCVDFFTSINSQEIKNLENKIECNIIQAAEYSQLKERFYVTKTETYKYLQINDCCVIKPIKLSVDTRKYDMIVISDYRLGIIQKDILDCLPKEKTICQMQISDSKEGFEKFFGFHSIIGNNHEIPQNKIQDVSNSLRLKVCISTNQEKDVAVFYDGRTTFVTPTLINDVKDYHGAGDAFYAGFCASYDFSTAKILSSIDSAMTSATTYLTRKHNVK